MCGLVSPPPTQPETARRRVVDRVHLSDCDAGPAAPLRPDRRGSYLLVAETFAPVAECALFWLAFGTNEELGKARCGATSSAIIIANLASFGIGEVINAWGWFGLLG